jgi:hypothetical protein
MTKRWMISSRSSFFSLTLPFLLGALLMGKNDSQNLRTNAQFDTPPKNAEVHAKAILVNDDCFEALPIGVSTPDNCTTEVTTNVSTATASGEPGPSCDESVNLDRWFSFTAPLDGNIRLVSNSLFNKFAIYAADNVNCIGDELACFSWNGFLYNAVGGQDYVLRVWKDIFEVSDITFCLEAFPILPNDECTMATPALVSQPGECTTEIIVDIRGATEDDVTVSGIPTCMSPNSNSPDVWYSFVSPVNGNILVNTNSSFNEFAIYDACGGTQLACFAGSGFLFDAVLGNTYLVRVWKEIFYGPVEFCIQAFPAVPNDECANAIGIPISGSGDCNTTVTVDILGATESPEPIPSCMSAPGLDLDVWYTFISPIDGNIGFTSNSDFNEFAIYDACAGTELACFAGNGFLNNAQQGTSYTIRVWKEAFFGPVSFCAQGFPVLPNDECLSATPIGVSAPDLCASNVVVDISSATQSAGVLPSCMSSGGGVPDAWYSFTSPVDGNVQIISDSEFNEFAIYDACAGTELACFAGEGFLFNAVQGNAYLLRVWKEDFFGPVDFCLYGHPAILNDECTTPADITIALPGECQSFEITVDLRGATESNNPIPSCMDINGDDMDAWYSFTVPENGASLNITSESSFNEYAIYDVCSGAELFCGNGSSTIPLLNAGQNYLLRVWKESVFGPLSLCIETCTIQCPPNPQPIEWPAGFNTDPVAPNVLQDPSVDFIFYGVATLSSNCDIESIDFEDVLLTPNPENCPNAVRSLVRTWSITDVNNASYSCEQVFHFSDNTIPEIECPSDVTIDCDQLTDMVAVGAATATDNCQVSDITFEDEVIFSERCPQNFSIQRIWTATDICGNPGTGIYNMPS